MNLVKKISTKKVLYIVIFLWALLQLSFALPDNIVNDWMGWRQSDTQTIARNFIQPGSNIFYPQINWGGNGPGYAETEFQLYTFLIAQIMRITGESVLPGQLLSLLFIALTALVTFFALLHYSKDEYASLFGAVFFLVSNGAVHLSTSVQPDSLCILFYSLALFSFLKYLDDQNYKLLFMWVLFSILSALIKPLALNIGIIQFFIIIFMHRHLLKSIKLWAGWFVIVSVTLSYLIFSYNLYLEYGNTFGVIGGDSKFPTLKGLTVFIHYPKLAYMTVLWGVGPIGLLAFVYLIYKKNLIRLEWALIIGNAAAILIPMRYTVNSGFSPHYYIFTALLGAWLAAFAFQLFNDNIRDRNIRQLFPVISVVLLILIYSSHLYMRMNPAGMHYHPSVTSLGYKLKEIAVPNSLAIVRSIANEKERGEWGNRINNYEDPRIFYVADIKGWSLPRDYKGFERVKEFVTKGADYYAEPYSNPIDDDLNKWLNHNSKLIYLGKDGRIYKF
jgi:hypothetical protein